MISQLIRVSGDPAKPFYQTVSPPLWSPFADLLAAWLTVTDPNGYTYARVVHI